MSIVEDNIITRLNYNRKEVGRKVKYSKQYHQWEFNLNGKYHKIELFHSIVSGRKKLVIDGEYLIKSESYLNNFKYKFPLDGIEFEIIQKKIDVYDLFICGKSFDIMRKEEASGTYKEIVDERLEELRKINKLNDDYDYDYDYENTNNNNNYVFEEEEEEDFDANKFNFKNENYSHNSHFRNDDDFYKSDGNNFDFSESAFEKNKKILENIDFFEDGNNTNKDNYNNNENKDNNSNNNQFNNFNFTQNNDRIDNNNMFNFNNNNKLNNNYNMYSDDKKKD